MDFSSELHAPEIIIIIGSLFLLVSLAEVIEKDPNGTIRLHTKGKNKIILGILGIILLIIGVLLYSPSIFVVPHAPTPKLHINHPLDESMIEPSTHANGTVENLPDGYTVLLFVYPETDGKYYPESTKVYIQNGTWYSDIYVGTFNNSGEHFRIVAALADKKAQAEVTNYFSNLNESNPSTLGMIKLPESITVSDEVRIVRA